MKMVSRYKIWPNRNESCYGCGSRVPGKHYRNCVIPDLPEEGLKVIGRLRDQRAINQASKKVIGARSVQKEEKILVTIRPPASCDRCGLFGTKM